MGMKKTVIATIAAVMCVGVCSARPFGPRFHGGFHRPPPIHHYHGVHWGHGGRYFWPGFVGGVIGSAVSGAVMAPFYRDTVIVQPSPTIIQPAPTIVQQPVIVPQPTVVPAQPVVAAPTTQTQNVWVEGRYVDQVQADGTAVRVWQPGHYEQRTVVVP